MIIGTLSTERRGNRQVLSGEERTECIAYVVDKFRPDLLLCAGHSLFINNDLERLIQDQRVRLSPTSIVVEVEEDDELVNNGQPADQHIIGGDRCQHRMHAIL